MSLRPGRRRGRPGVLRAAVLTVLLMLATTLSALAPTGDRSRTASTDSQPVAAAPPAVTRGGAVPGAAGKAVPAPGAVDAAVEPGEAPRPAVATMSFDEPIQGGLTARQAQAASARVRAAHADAGIASSAGSWTPAMGRTAVARARSWLGMPYSWAGGAASGPTAGRCEPGQGADLDCHIVGFDCSGLMMYAWGPYASLPHFAQTQREAGAFHPTVAQLRAGDMVFFSGYLPDGIGHVAIYEGDGLVIEAPQSGGVVRRSALADLMAENGTYRGAVRPLTAPTPTFAAHPGAVPRAGGTVTLHGSHLSGITSLTLATPTGPRTVRDVARRSDSTVRIEIPRAPAGRTTITVTARTPWGAASAPLTLTYAAPAAPTPPPTRSTPAPTKPSPTKPSPTKPTPAPTKPTPAPTKPTPAPTKSTPSPAPSTSAPTRAVPSPVPPGTTTTAAAAAPAG